MQIDVRDEGAGKSLRDERLVIELIGRSTRSVRGGERKDRFVQRDVPRNVHALGGYMIASVSFVLVTKE
jgi:hypothetical protein